MSRPTPSPETAPRMHAAANESIERMFRCGCDLERQLADALAQLRIADEQLALEQSALAAMTEERDALAAELATIQPPQ